MPEPRVTVIVPAYNMAEFLGEALESLLAQSLSAFEALVIDDGSTDATPEVAARFTTGGERGDGRIRYQRQENQGKLAALERGIRLARGEMVCVLDADDTLPPQSLELRVRALDRHPQAVAVYADADYMDRQGRVYRRRRSRPFRSLDELLASAIVPVIGASLMTRRRVLEEMLPLDKSFVRSDDAYLNVEVFRRGPMIYLPEVVYNYRNYPRPENLRLRLLSIKHDLRLIRRYRRGPRAWWLMLKKGGSGLLKLAYELVTPRK